MSDWLAASEALASDGERRAFWAAGANPDDAPARIHGRVLALLYTDFEQAARAAELAAQYAAWSTDGTAAAFAARCAGHVHYLRGEHAAAAGAYEEAVSLFKDASLESEVARTLSSGLQALSYLGRYEEARQWAERAREIFARLGDVLRLARLDSNIGNLFFRLDQPREAMVRYESALAGFQERGDAKDVAAVLSNIAVCRTNLGQFAGAMEAYREAREHCSRHGLNVLAAQADYNIAYLFYQRGDYGEARRQYAISREHCVVAGDAYHAALCDLDEAEMALELNLTDEGAALARRAEAGFSVQGLRYEQAKALVNMAVAESQRGNGEEAERHLHRARRLFVKEGNATWPALVDQLNAVLAYHTRRYGAAQRLGARAWRALQETMVPGRAAHCQLLLARLWLRQGRAERARSVCQDALAQLGDGVSPSLRFHANLIEGEINESQGRREEALRSYEAARRDVEDLRGRVDSEDLRISILKDKLAVYESLCAMYLEKPGVPGGDVQAMALVQQAKSRSLADRVSATGGDLVKPLWRELRWLYRQSSLSATLQRAGIVCTGRREIQERVCRVEQELRTAQENTASVEAKPEDVVDLLRASLPDGAVFLEYFEARDTLYLFRLGRTDLKVLPLGSCAEIRHALRLLHFQLGKPRAGLGASAAAREAVTRHLQELYRLLLGPAELSKLGCEHVVIAPYRQLHGLPFAALDDGERALMDRVTVSRTPSAAVFAACRSRPRRDARGALVMAMSDRRAPRIGEEAREVAELLGDASLLTGEAASIDAFREFAPAARIVHLAAHGEFRRDNPAFSAIRLADGGLGVLDLQEIDLGMDLLTLSACNTGSSVPVGGDELLGLVRGFLTAGARSVLASLWEIDDASAQAFMRSFYGKVRIGERLPVALRYAMNEIRERYPHPYYWAPYVLVGDPESVVRAFSFYRVIFSFPVLFSVWGSVPYRWEEHAGCENAPDRGHIVTLKKTHFTEGAWSDYARGVGPSDARARMDEHLQTNCEECLSARRFAAEMVSFGTVEQEFVVPDELVMRAKGVFRAPSSAAGWMETLERVAAELVHEIRSDWELAGVRSGSGGPHRLVYRAGPYGIDLSLEKCPDSGFRMVTGQIECDGGDKLGDSVVQVWVDGLAVAETHTNPFGEFVAEYPAGLAAELRIGILTAGRRVDVALPGAG